MVKHSLGHITLAKTLVESVEWLMRGGSPCLDRLLTSHGGCVLSVLPSSNTLSFRYGFDYGNIHFVIMSTEHDFWPDSPQYQWLDNHFKTVNRTTTPWLVFAGHRYYCHLHWRQDTQQNNV